MNGRKEGKGRTDEEEEGERMGERR